MKVAIVDGASVKTQTELASRSLFLSPGSAVIISSLQLFRT